MRPRNPLGFRILCPTQRQDAHTLSATPTFFFITLTLISHLNRIYLSALTVQHNYRLFTLNLLKNNSK